MKIYIHLKPNSKHASIKRMDDSHFSVKVTEPARDGKANRALIKSLAERFDVAQSRIHIRSGLKSRRKVVEIV